MNLKRKLIHIQLKPILSGAQKVSLEELKAAAKNGFDIGLILKEEGELSNKVSELTTNIYFCKSLRREISPLYDLISLFKLYKILKKIKPEIVHTHSSKTGILGRFAAYLARVPVIIHTVHGYALSSTKNVILKNLYFCLELLTSRITSKIIVMNKEDERYTLEVLRVPKNKVYNVPNGICLEKYKRRDPIKRKDDVYEIAMVGRLCKQKDPFTLLKAAKILRDKNYRKFEVKFIGDGELKAQMLNFIEENGLTQNVKILGWKKDISESLKHTQLLVLPSLWEGFPLTILEGMALGIPIVATNISGNNDIICHMKNGILFEPENYKDLTYLLEEFILNRIEINEITDFAFRDILEQFNTEIHARNILSLYS